ncbi:MAG TPA: histidinol-phosphatase HisJ family protein [Firmicutes bacterium]|nr:histidinol-phosphatase HisJ family protein [Bacillota bacterium]
MLVDYHVHTLGHDAFYVKESEIARYYETALARGVKELGIADHDYYYTYFQPERILAQARRFPELTVRVGIEVDYIPGREAEIRALLEAQPLDFVIGSVHQVDGFSFDEEKDVPKYAAWETTALFRRYFAHVARAAESGLFDIIGHLDLIKIFNFVPAEDMVALAEPALAGIRRAGTCLELNTNGRYKPVHEFYPAQALLARCHEVGIPLTLGSDAHAPEQAGRDIAAAAALARRAGYTAVATFQGRRRTLVPLG